MRRAMSDNLRAKGEKAGWANPGCMIPDWIRKSTGLVRSGLECELAGSERHWAK